MKSTPHRRRRRVTGTAGLAYGSWTDFRGNPGITPANQDVMIQSFAP